MHRTTIHRQIKLGWRVSHFYKGHALDGDGFWSRTCTQVQSVCCTAALSIVAAVSTHVSSSRLHAPVQSILMHSHLITSKIAMWIGTKYVAHMFRFDSDTSYHAYFPRCKHTCAALAKKAPHMAQLRSLYLCIYNQGWVSIATDVVIILTCTIHTHGNTQKIMFRHWLHMTDTTKARSVYKFHDMSCLNLRSSDAIV